ncbi:hypothetical protein Tco_0924996 [Tanacetum coccineum]|uniref:Uncharacterized protein n=1 Tax=Tanacetum coccineum TaxID=301880 RepID=A0ABQ5D893_9ASTR
MITATIDGQVKTITKESLRRHLKLEDQDGVDILPNIEIFEHLALMGYNTDLDMLTFQKGTFSPQWRFIQICLDMQKKYLQPYTRLYLVPSLNANVFNNMKRPTKGYSGVEIDLFPAMLHVPTPESSPAPSSSPSRITSSSSPSTEHSPAPSTAEPTSTATPTTSEPQPNQPSPATEDHVPIPHDSPLHVVHSHKSREGSMQLTDLMNLVTKLSDMIGVLENDLKKTKQTYSTALTKLVLKVKKLEKQVKARKSRRRTRIVLSEEEHDSLDDSSKQGRRISDIDEDPDTYIVQDDGVEWIQEEVTEVQEKIINDTEPVIQDDTPTEVIEDKGSGEKGEKEVSTDELPVSTAHIDISTTSTIHRETRSTAGRVVYSRRSIEKKDKGKAIMIEPELKKKSKKEIEQ